MGQIAEALRANLRTVAASDARSIRKLDQELRAARETISSSAKLPQGAAAENKLSDGLDKLSVSDLKAQCRRRGLRGYSALRKADLISLLRSDGSTPTPSTPSGRPEHRNVDLQALEKRMERMESLLLRIASAVGIDAQGEAG